MPVEVFVENQVCKNCGADVRPHALFCYSCGSSVASDSAVKQNGNNNRAKIGSDKQEFAEKPIAKPVLEDAAKPSDKPFKDLSKTEIERAEIENKKLTVEKETVLKTAASVRRQAKPPRKKVEYVWEQPRESVNIWFVAAAIILTLFAVAALLAMLYLH